jgi:large subunit ribosomal protein L24
MQKIKVNDEVLVTTGKDKGKTGKVLDINFKTLKVVVDGINSVKRAVKPTQQNPQGGFVSKFSPIDISNIALVSPKTKKPSRVKIELKDGKSVRVLKACGTVLS